ncbi:HAD-IA family hydrolase [Paracoccaceae bacterium]|nr:HAD-IA family hydrolase [Paracoccaceae bacterium]
MDKNLKAVFFGSIGTIAETSEIQRRSYNLAFNRLSIDCYWNVANYCEMLKVPGGKDRIRNFTTPNISEEDVDKIHNLKEEIYAELIEQEDISRLEFVEVFHHSKASDLKLGLITTTSKKNIDSLSRALEDKVNFSDFDIITTSKDCINPKPNPEIYQNALRKIGVSPNEVIAIEDTQVNLGSSLSANIDSILYPGEYSNYTKEVQPSFNLMEKIFQI